MKYIARNAVELLQDFRQKDAGRIRTDEYVGCSHAP